ncbi:MAG: VWA domain-containing protein [Acidobacteria bacterium]|nr:VWA domain-containing protein [Acidobacteriota bacterium]
MSYSAEISRASPSVFLFIIDQSGSMDEKMPDGISKSNFVADVLNKTLYHLIIRCTKLEGVRNYFDVGVIAYGGTGVGAGFSGALSGNVLHPLSAIEASPLRVEERTKRVPDGAGGLVDQAVKFPVWFNPVNEGGTPMCEAMRHAAEMLVQWCDSHQGSYPPTVIHVTDGQSTDGDPEGIADALKKISTSDGQCLLFNLHIDASGGDAIIFPSSESGLPDAYSKMLFRMSSAFPPHLVKAAHDKKYNVSNEARFFGYKAGYEGIVDFFDIGTRASNLR